jgi:hypothetical protein
MAPFRGMLLFMKPSLDPDLIGIWIVRGKPVTYEVTGDGGYHVADPEEPLSFEQDGAVMIWGGRRHERQDGSGQSPVGRWIEPASGDAWLFEPDGRYEITGAGATDTGIWALRDGGAALWTRELTAQISTNGAQVTFDTVSGGSFIYGYTVKDGVWSLLDPTTWVAVTRYVTPARLAALI